MIFKSKIKEIRKDIYIIENKKYISTPGIKEIDKNLIKLENNFSKLKTYYDHNDIEYKGIIDLRNLFDLSIDEDYHKPIKTNDAFNSNYIEYESKGDEDKTLSIKEYIYVIRPYLSDITNYHKTQGEWEVHLGNT